MFLFFILLFTFTIIYVVKLRSSRLYKMVFKLPPALPELPIIGIALNFLGNSEVIMNSIIKASYNTMKLGGATRCFSFHTCRIALTDASDIAEVLTHYLDKDYVYSFLQEITGNGSAFAPAYIAKGRRRIVMPSFTPKILNSFVDVFWEESVRLTEMLAPHVGNGSFSVEEYLKLYSFNTILKVSGVKDLGDRFCEKELFNSVSQSFKLAVERMSRIWLYPNFVHKFSSNYTETQRSRKILHHYADMVIEKRTISMKNYSRPTASRELCKLQGQQEGIFDTLLNSKLSNEDIREEIIVLLGANDLTSISLGYTLMLLGFYPAVQANVYKELQHIFGETNRPLVKDDLMKMSYLDRVIKETLRLFPPGPVIARIANKEVTLSSGRIVPAGAGVITSILGLHRNPKYWGPQAEHFDPDRFLPERFNKVHPKAYMPFSYGARNCIGYTFGLMTMKIALSTIVRKYEVVGQPAQFPIPNIRTKFEGLMLSVNNFKIELVKRI